MSRPPDLILLNGAPGVGKTTLAQRFADAHPLTLVLDIDTLRSLIGGWRTDPLAAGRLARLLATDLATAALRNGQTVVVPQFLGRPEFVLELARTATDAGVRFMEVVVTAPLPVAVARFAERSASLVDDVQVAGAPDDAEAMIAEAIAAVDAVADGRPGTCRVDNGGDTVEPAYLALRSVVTPVEVPISADTVDQG